MNSSSCLFLGFILIVVSCGQADSDANSYSGKVKEELRSREVVHLTPGQISERAFALGDSLIAKAAATFAADIQKSGDSVCTLVFQKTARVIKSRYDATIMRIPFDATRLATISSKREKEILDAYFYNRENKLPLEPNLQGDGQKEFLFTKPLTISDKSCLRCHEQHPNPSLKGILGDTIGIWDLRLTKKTGGVVFCRLTYPLNSMLRWIGTAFKALKWGNYPLRHWLIFRKFRHPFQVPLQTTTNQFWR